MNFVVFRYCFKSFSKLRLCTSYDAIVVDTCHYTFVQIRRTYSSKNEPSGKLGLWVMTACQCRVTCSKGATLVGHVANLGEAVLVWRKGTNGKSLCLLISAVSLKPFLKKPLLQKN